MKTKLIRLDATQFGVEKNRAREMESAFVPMLNRLTEMETEYNTIIRKSNDGITKEICHFAYTLRWQYVKLRTKVDEVHQAGKKEVLLLGRAWDGLKNQYLSVTNQNEETLQKIERHFEILELARKNKLKDQRQDMLFKYEVETEHIALGEMSSEVWDNYLRGVELQYDNRIAAEKKVEVDRIAKEKALSLHEGRKTKLLHYWQHLPVASDMFFGDMSKDAFYTIFNDAKKAKEANDKKQEAIRKENKRLQKDAEIREKAILIEREKAEAKQKAIEAKAKKDADAREEAMQVVIRQEEAKREIIEENARKEREAAVSKAKIEADAKAKIEAELQAKKDVEVKREADKQAAIEAELSKGDEDKFESLLNDLSELQTKYTFKSKEYQDLQTDINELIDEIITFKK